MKYPQITKTRTLGDQRIFICTRKY